MSNAKTIARRLFNFAVQTAVHMRLAERLPKPLRNQLSKIYMRMRVSLRSEQVPNPFPYKGMMIHYPQDSFLGQELAAETFEGGADTLLAALLKPGDFFVDVGTHIGIYSLLAARLGAQVLSFEPDPYTYSLFQQNIDANHVSDRVKPVNALVSDTSGKGKLYIESHDRLTSTSVATLSRNWEAVECDMYSLDDYFATHGISHVDCLKVDVEGAETQVLNGFRQTNALNPKMTLIIEFAVRNQRAAGVDPRSLLELIASLGFNRFQIAGETDEYHNLDDVLTTINKHFADAFPNLVCRKS